MIGCHPSPGATTPQAVNMMNEALGRQVAGSSLCEVVPEHMVELAKIRAPAGASRVKLLQWMKFVLILGRPGASAASSSDIWAYELGERDYASGV